MLASKPFGEQVSIPGCPVLSATKPAAQQRRMLPRHTWRDHLAALHSALFLLQALTNGCKTWVVALKIFAVVFKDLVLHPSLQSPPTASCETAWPRLVTRGGIAYRSIWSCDPGKSVRRLPTRPILSDIYATRPASVTAGAFHGRDRCEFRDYLGNLSGIFCGHAKRRRRVVVRRWDGFLVRNTQRPPLSGQPRDDR